MFKAQRLVYHSTLDWRVVKKKKWFRCGVEEAGRATRGAAESEFFIDNLLVRIHFIIEMF